MNPHFGAELRRRRVAAGTTLRDLAAVVPCSVGYLSRLERGERTPSQSVAAALDHALHADGTLIAQASARRSFMTGQTSEEADTDRRVVLQGLTAAGMAVAGWPTAPAARWQLPRRITSAHVADVVDTTQVYRQWVSRHGGAAVRKPAAVLLERAAALHTAASDPTVRTALLVAIADLAGLGAYIARDLGAHDDAHQHYRLSLSAAQAGDEVALGAHTIVRMAGHHIELRRPAQVLSLLNAAEHGARGRLTPGEVANHRCIAAWAHAQTGNTQATLRAMGQAEDALARSDGDRRPWAAQHVTEAELHSLLGAALVDLARYDRRHAAFAVERLTRALDLRGPSAARNRTLDQISLAEALVCLGEIDEAGRVGLRALDGMQGVASARLRLRIEGLRRSVAGYARGYDSVAAFVDRAR